MTSFTATPINFRYSVIAGAADEAAEAHRWRAFNFSHSESMNQLFVSLLPLLVSLGFSSTPLPSFSFHQSSVLKREARGIQKGRRGREPFVPRPSASCCCCRDDPSKYMRARVALLWNSALMQTLWVGLPR